MSYIGGGLATISTYLRGSVVVGCSLFVDPVGKMEEDLYDVCEREREREREREGEGAVSTH